MTHPLDDTFDISAADLLDDDLDEVVIPDDPNLDTIIKLSLQAYKSQMNDILHIEPKNRARYLEVAEKFLNQAKDAMAKKEQIKLSREKQQPRQPAGAPTATNTGQPGEGVTVTREQLSERLRAVK